MASIDLEELERDLAEGLDYERTQMHHTVFIEFLRKLIDKDTRVVAINKWIELAGIEKEDNGKVVTRRGEYKEVELVDDEGNVLDIVPPMMTSDLTEITGFENITNVLSESAKKVEVYGAAGDAELNFKMASAATDMTKMGNSTWESVILKYLTSGAEITKTEVSEQPNDNVETNDDEDVTTYYE